MTSKTTKSSSASAPGSGWMIFLWPPLARTLFQYVMLFGIGELALPLWLIVKGVNVERWRQKAVS